MDPVARMIDANANRAGEALRTLEDVARFALDDAVAVAALKSARHDLAMALRALPPGWLTSNRDTPGDVGTSITTDDESQRRGLHDVAAAAGRRAAEALRVLEESTKIVDARPASAIEAIRYRVYDLAADLQRRAPGSRREQWRVCVLLTESLCTRPWRDVAHAAIDGGADALQLREKDLDGGELMRRAEWLVGIARPRGVRIIVNDRADVAIASGADGVHVGQTDLSPTHVRQLCGTRLAVGMSTHSVAEADRAAAEGADYCGVGAMFPTAVKPGVEAGGVATLRAYLDRHAALPHLAIGGITPKNIDVLVDAGCRGVAVSTCVCAAAAPDRVVAELRSALSRATAGATS